MLSEPAMKDVVGRSGFGTFMWQAGWLCVSERSNKAGREPGWVQSWRKMWIIFTPGQKHSLLQSWPLTSSCLFFCGGNTPGGLWDKVESHLKRGMFDVYTGNDTGRRAWWWRWWGKMGEFSHKNTFLLWLMPVSPENQWIPMIQPTWILPFRRTGDCKVSIRDNLSDSRTWGNNRIFLLYRRTGSVW